MVDIEKSIADCCKQLRLSSNFSSQAMTQKGESQQEYLLNLLTNEIKYRMERRKSKYLNTAGLINLFSESQSKGNLTALKKKLNSAQILILDEFGYVPYDRTGSQLLFDYLSEIHEQKSVILNTNLEFSQWVNVLYDQRMTTALIGRLTHHVELILFPGINNRLRESSINEALSRINRQEER